MNIIKKIKNMLFVLFIKKKPAVDKEDEFLKKEIDASYNLDDICYFGVDYVLLNDGTRYYRDSIEYKKYEKIKTKERKKERCENFYNFLIDVFVRYVPFFILVCMLISSKFNEMYNPNIKLESTDTISINEIYQVNYPSCQKHDGKCSQYVVVAENNYYIFNSYKDILSKYEYDSDNLIIDVLDQEDAKPVATMGTYTYEYIKDKTALIYEKENIQSYKLLKISIPDGYIIPFKNVYGVNHSIDY